jgi:hypothetical protein
MFARILALTITLTAIVVLPPAALTGCPAPAGTVTNAIATAQQAAQTAATVVADAQVVWPIVYAAIPADKQAAAQTAFNESLFTANHAILTLNDLIAAAIAANNPNPDFTAVIGQLSGAVAQVVAIVQQFLTTSAVASHVRTAGGVDAVADMSAAAGRLKALTVQR